MAAGEIRMPRPSVLRFQQCLRRTREPGWNCWPRCHYVPDIAGSSIFHLGSLCGCQRTPFSEGLRCPTLPLRMVGRATVIGRVPGLGQSSRRLGEGRRTVDEKKQTDWRCLRLYWLLRWTDLTLNVGTMAASALALQVELPVVALPGLVFAQVRPAAEPEPIPASEPLNSAPDYLAVGEQAAVNGHSAGLLVQERALDVLVGMELELFVLSFASVVLHSVHLALVLKTVGG